MWFRCMRSSWGGGAGPTTSGRHGQPAHNNANHFEEVIMSQAIYIASVESCAASLGSLSEILAKAAARLAPDMFPLFAQVQLACYQAVAGAKRLAGREAVRPAMQEADFGALRAHIAEALKVLAMF